MGRLEGKNVLVTGGSRGIGAGIVKSLAHEGARVAFTYTSSPDRAEKVHSELPGEGHFHFSMNISDEISVNEGIEHVLKEFDSIDGLVNNAGITRDQLILRMKTEEFDDVINTNLRGTFLCTRPCLKAMLKKRSGSIVNITSVIGQSGNAGQTNYAASKAGIEAFTKSIGQEVGSRNIRANCIAPGFIATEMTDELTEQQKQAILGKIPLRRMRDVSDIANAVIFLLSDESTYITGQTISVNGGLYM